MNLHMTLLKTLCLATLLAATLSPSSIVIAGDYYGFSDILMGESYSNENTDIKPTKLEANLNGGVIQLRMPDTSGTCVGDYEFRWEFLDDISKLEAGEKYRFRIAGRRVGGSCEMNTNTAMVKGSSDSSRLADSQGASAPGRRIDVTTAPSSITAHPRYKSQVTSSDGFVSVVGNIGERTQFSLHFEFASFPYSSVSKSCNFDVVYLYRKNHIAAPTALNCPNLYGLGVNIGILEYGSLEDAKTSFLAGFVDHAIAHSKASGCVPASETAWLIDLKQRMLKKPTSREFAREISDFRQKLAHIIEGGCNCR